MEERKDLVTFKGNPVTLVGKQVKVGQEAPEFKLLDNSFKTVSLSRSKSKVKLVSVTFSLETPICDMQTRTFDEAVGKCVKSAGYSVSMDLPFTLGRYAKEHPTLNLKLLTDYYDASFGTAYGLLVKENRLLARAVFVIGYDNTVRYAEYVKEITQAPNYEKALKALDVAAAEK
ncbi:MAG TPA: thiol peroxidase [Dehalococcoidales bacterium]|nr:thiol peroxidase [Dehalococcoidales bacterium]